MRGPTRLQRAVAIRDHLLPLIRQHGTFQPKNHPSFIQFIARGFEVYLNSPFLPLPKPRPPALFYEDALLWQRAKLVLPWRMAILNYTGKVLSLEWDNDEHAALISMRPGPWEAEILLVDGPLPARR
jgi:hypothetical protein